MSEKLMYTTRTGSSYYFREVTGARGTQIVCSQKESDNDLVAIPETHEIAESPKGKVSCRKKMKSSITRKEASYAEDILPSMVGPQIRLFVETKKKAIIIHSKELSRMDRLVDRLPGNRAENLALLADNIPFEPMLKMELTDKESRTFTAFRMCWLGASEEWMFLKEGSVYELVEEFGPHIGHESFFELF